MALNLPIRSEKGVVATYHRALLVTQVYEPSNAGVHINLAGYASKEYRDIEKEKQALGEQCDMIITNTPIKLPFTDNDFSLANIYARLKEEIPELANSLDI